MLIILRLHKLGTNELNKTTENVFSSNPAKKEERHLLFKKLRSFNTRHKAEIIRTKKC